MKILFYGSVPPPLHGASYANSLFVSAPWPEGVEIRHVDCFLSRSLEEMNRFSLPKIFRLLRGMGRLLWDSLTFSPDWVVVPVAFNRGSFLKDGMAVLLMGALRRRVALWCHGQGYKPLRSGKGVLMRLFCRTVMAVPSAVVTPSRQAGLDNAFQSEFQNRWRTIPYGIPDLPRLCPPPQGEGVKVLFLSNMLQTKGWMTLWKAACNLCPRHDGLSFDFYGQETAEISSEELERFFAQGPSPERIRYRGPAYGETKERAFAQADIFCFPTYYPYETFGIVLVEAMRAGLPLVASRYSGIPEILAEGEGGFLVPPDSVEGLEGEIERLLLDPSLRESMGSFNRRRFESHYTMKAAVNGWLRLFEELQGQEEGERVAP